MFPLKALPNSFFTDAAPVEKSRLTAIIDAFDFDEYRSLNRIGSDVVNGAVLRISLGRVKNGRTVLFRISMPARWRSSGSVPLLPPNRPHHVPHSILPAFCGQEVFARRMRAWKNLRIHAIMTFSGLNWWQCGKAPN